MPRPLRILLALSPTILFAIVAAIYLGARWDAQSPPAGSSDRGRLVIVAVFDQMRGDFPDRWAKLYGPDGFARFKRDGVHFRNAHLPYSCSSTAPGHASIGTGVPPSVHGVVENKWYDRKRKVETFAVTGERAYTRVPRLGTPVPSFAPDQLLVDGIGDHLKRTHTDSRVFSIALKDRAAVLTGGKKPDGVYCFDTTAGEFHTSSYYRDRVHPWVGEFNTSRAADRWFDRSWVRFGDEATYTAAVGPDDRPGETQFERDAKTGGRVGYGPTFPHALNVDGQPHPNVRYYDRVEASPFGNELVWDLAQACITAEQLGRNGAADLLFLGFSSNDVIGHRWGPDSHEVLDVTVRTDRLLGEMIAFLDRELGSAGYSLVVTSDHGICPHPEVSRSDHPDASRFDPRAEFGPDGLGRVLNEKFGVVDPGGTDWFEYVDRGYTPQIFLNHRAIASLGADPAAVTAFVANWAANRPHMLSAFTREALTGPPADDPLVRKCQLGFHPDRCGDVVHVHQPYHIPMGIGSTGTTHGSPHPYDTHVPILAFGAGVPRLGPIDDAVSSLAVGPMLCELLGINPPDLVTEPLPHGWEK